MRGLRDLGERPDLRDAADALVAANLPPFLTWASPGNWRWHRLYAQYPEYQLVTTGEGGRVRSAVHSVPLHWNGDPAALPAGYDDALVAATCPPVRSANTTCLVSISIDREERRSGLAERLITEAKQRARDRGHAFLIAPLRPTRKSEFPDADFADYLGWQNAEGNIFDPWLKLHVSLGAEILGIADRSLVIRQPAARWASLLGLPGLSPGRYPVPGGLAPIEIEASGVGEYAEPNVWIGYKLGGLHS